MLSLLSVSTSNERRFNMDDFNQYKNNLETFEEFLFSKSYLEEDDDIDIFNVRKLSSITQSLISDMEADYE